jgi:hypothetical protein
LPIDEQLVENTLENIQSGNIDETVLDELQVHVRCLAGLVNIADRVFVGNNRSSTFSRRTNTTDNSKARHRFPPL